VDVSVATANIHVGLQSAEVHAGRLTTSADVVEDDGTDSTRIGEPAKAIGETHVTDVIGTKHSICAGTDNPANYYVVMWRVHVDIEIHIRIEDFGYRSTWISGRCIASGSAGGS
jgi:hypothetical protein